MVFLQELQHQERAQIALGAFAVHFCFGTMSTSFRQRDLAQATRVAFQLVNKFLELFAAWQGGSIFRKIKPRLQRAVHKQIWIAANWTCEMRVLLAGQRVMANQRGRICGLGKRLEHRHVNSARGISAAGFLKQREQILALRFIGQAKANTARECAQLLHGLKRWRRMNAANKRNGKFSEQARHGFVGLDHEHFNQRVREGVVLRHGVNHMAGFVKN